MKDLTRFHQKMEEIEGLSAQGNYEAAWKLKNF